MSTKDLVIQIKWSSKKTKYTFWTILYWLILIISYVWALQNHFGSAFILEFDYFRFVIGTLLVLIVLLFLPINDSIYSFFLTICFYLIVIPMGCIYCCTCGSTLYFFSVSLLYVFICLAIERLKLKRIEIFVSNNQNVSIFTVFAAIVLIIITAIALLYERGIPNLDALNFKEVYTIRESYDLNSRFNSLVKITTQVLIPFLITISFLKRRRYALVVLLLLQFVFYLWLAHKTVLFSLVVIILGYYLSKKDNRNLIFSKILTISVFVLTLMEGISWSLNNKFFYHVYNIYGLVVRRALFVPAYLKQYYYSYFVIEDHDLAGLFGTIVAPILTRLRIHNPYSQISYSQLLGNIYWNGANSNTGMFGGELAHFGYIGLFVAALCFLLVLMCVKSSEKLSGKTFTCSIAIYSIVSLTNGKAMDLICFSPLLLLCIILLTFNLNTNLSKDVKSIFKNTKDR